MDIVLEEKESSKQSEEEETITQEFGVVQGDDEREEGILNKVKQLK